LIKLSYKTILSDIIADEEGADTYAEALGYIHKGNQQIDRL
jgi:hypothetical protein